MSVLFFFFFFFFFFFWGGGGGVGGGRGVRREGCVLSPPNLLDRISIIR